MGLKCGSEEKIWRIWLNKLHDVVGVFLFESWSRLDWKKLTEFLVSSCFKRIIFMAISK